MVQIEEHKRIVIHMRKIVYWKGKVRYYINHGESYYLLQFEKFVLEASSLVQIHYYLCNFVVRDIKIAVYLESPRKTDFNLVTDFLSSK